MQRLIEKNKSIQETPQHLCVSVDVRNNEKSNIDLEEAISVWVCFEAHTCRLCTLSYIHVVFSFPLLFETTENLQVETFKK